MVGLAVGDDGADDLAHVVAVADSQRTVVDERDWYARSLFASADEMFDGALHRLTDLETAADGHFPRHDARSRCDVLYSTPNKVLAR